MNIIVLKLRQLASQSIKPLLLASFLSLNTSAALAAPGAHGPDGEHLDTEKPINHFSNPRFEAFTESFEMVGELLGDELRVYLHDYSTNTPVKHASIELESDNLTVQAQFDQQRGRYVISDATFLSSIKQPGEHAIVATVLTEDNGDLLAATFNVPTKQSTAQHEPHYHFPWKAAGLTLAVFIVGVALGRRSKGGRS